MSEGYRGELRLHTAVQITSGADAPTYPLKYMNFPLFKKSCLSGLVFAIFIAPCGLIARFAPSSLVPVDALIQRADDLLGKAPEDSSLHYLKGRIHYLAFINQSDSVPALPTKKPSVVAYWQSEKIPQSERENITDLPVEHAMHHANLARESFLTALELTPEDALAWLGYASLLEQVTEFRESHSTVAIETFSSITSQTIRDAYYKAWKNGLTKAQDTERRPPMGLRGIVSYEAGTNFLRLAEDTDEDPSRIESVKSSLNSLEGLRRGPITPIIFSLDAADKLVDLTSSDQQVLFDLDGDGNRENWQWLAPEAYLLVWDPSSTGDIQSGRQLFGNYTFQIPWINGYEALAMLDSDGSGAITGIELTGIRAWSDQDSDGVSSPEEVVDLEALGIVALYYQYQESKDGPYSRDGIELVDGSMLQTWDWISSRTSR